MAFLASAISLHGQDPRQFSEEQMRDFLLNAKVVKSQKVSQGKTGIHRLTLSDGKITHDAAFQAIDEYKTAIQYSDGQVESDFRDSYKFNLAAYELAKLLGLGEMMPVTVERRWSGATGSLSWWLPSGLDEEKRQKQKIQPPDNAAFNKQFYKMLVFSELVYDTDRNPGNILYSEDWHLWMIDFTRAFRTSPDLLNIKNLVRCDRQLFQKLHQLNAAELAQNTRKWLSDTAIQGLMARRDKIVQRFEQQIAEKGERQVLYD